MAPGARGACGSMDRVTDAVPPGFPGPEELPVPGGEPPGHGLPEYPDYAERVLSVAEIIPPGRVMTYGDVAEWLGEGGPRQVGRVMALYGGAVPWWRVVRADGVLLPGRERVALGHYREEGTPLRITGPAAEGHVPRIAMRRARWDGVPAGGAGGEPGEAGAAAGAAAGDAGDVGAAGREERGRQGPAIGVAQAGPRAARRDRESVRGERDGAGAGRAGAGAERDEAGAGRAGAGRSLSRDDAKSARGGAARVKRAT
ncbi:MGMT family protein [Streptomyces sp. URMC 126]|uniref:MGMT family protein n=1 Tax=Streptomyces sp. URMC 126 TaxID=3423401 RepID=UPI003F195AB2